MYQTILVPLDGSQRAEAILPHVEEIARRFAAKVIFLQVIESQPVMEITTFEFTSLIKEAEIYLKAHSNALHKKGIETKNVVQVGPAVGVIIDIAARENADLIAMASHGRSGLSRVFYGSVAAGILQRVDRPLLLIRSREYE